MTSDTIVVIDWDETVSVNDTLPLAASQSLAPYTAAYLDDYSNYSQQVAPVESVDDERRFQQGLRLVEQQSIDRLEKGHALKWTSPPLGKLPQLRPGVAAALRGCNQMGLPVVILSLNWTSYWMRKAMAAEGIVISNYICNEVDFTTGKFTNTAYGNIYTGADKERVVAALEARGQRQCIMVGDSRSDILAMLRASGGGMVIKDGGHSAVSALSAVGVSISDTLVTGLVVWWTWSQFHQWLRGQFN